MVRTQIQLTEEQTEKLKKIAGERHLSIAELIRQAVDNLIKTGFSLDAEERKRRALAAAGMFSSGEKDISNRHDEYLAGAFKK